MNLEMLEEKQLSHGKRDCPKYFKVTKQKIFGMLMRKDASGEHSQTKVWGK